MFFPDHDHTVWFCGCMQRFEALPDPLFQFRIMQGFWGGFRPKSMLHGKKPQGMDHLREQLISGKGGDFSGFPDFNFLGDGHVHAFFSVHASEYVQNRCRIGFLYIFGIPKLKEQERQQEDKYDPDYLALGGGMGVVFLQPAAFVALILVEFTGYSVVSKKGMDCAVCFWEVVLDGMGIYPACCRIFCYFIGSLGWLARPADTY